MLGLRDVRPHPGHAPQQCFVMQHLSFAVQTRHVRCHAARPPCKYYQRLLSPAVLILDVRAARPARCYRCVSTSGYACFAQFKATQIMPSCCPARSKSSNKVSTLALPLMCLVLTLRRRRHPERRRSCPPHALFRTESESDLLRVRLHRCTGASGPVDDRLEPKDGAVAGAGAIGPDGGGRSEYAAFLKTFGLTIDRETLECLNQSAKIATREQKQERRERTTLHP